MEEQLAEVKVQLESQFHRIGSLSTSVDEKNQRIDALTAENQARRSEITRIQAEGEARITSLEQRLTDLQAANEKLATDLESSHAAQAALQSSLDLLTLPAPNVSDKVIVEGTLGDRRLASIPIIVSALQEVRGEIVCTPVPCEPNIQDPAGNSVQTFGRVNQTNFLFVAEMDGQYSLVIQNPHSDPNPYSVSYAVYSHYDHERGRQ